MMGRTHMMTGLLGWVAIAPTHVTSELAPLAAGAVVSIGCALGPDLDHGSSKASRALWGPFHQQIGGFISKVFGGHRKGLHTTWSVIGVGVLGTVAALTLAPLLWSWLDVGGVDLLPWLAAAMMIGWGAHIVGDMLTVQGVPIFWPFWKRSFRFANLETGGRGESIFAVLQLAAIAYVSYRQGIALWEA